MDEIIQKYKLIQDNDFSYLENDRYLMTMNINKDTPAEQIKGGSNLLQREMLPNINLGNRMIVTASWTGSGGSGYGNRIHWRYDPTYLNGDVKQTEFKPKYHGIVAVRFLKDIKEVSNEN